VLWNDQRSRWVEHFLTNSLKLQDFEDFVEQNIVEMHTILDALFAFEHDLHLDLGIIDWAATRQEHGRVSEQFWQVENDTVECAHITDHSLMLLQVFVAEFHVFDL
jgi:hypothetical protein